MQPSSSARYFPNWLRGLVCLALTCRALPAHAAGASHASDAMQVSVLVVRACAIDTNAVNASALVERTQGLLTASCGADHASVTLTPPSPSTYRARAGALWLDVEF